MGTEPTQHKRRAATPNLIIHERFIVPRLPYSPSPQRCEHKRCKGRIRGQRVLRRELDDETAHLGMIVSNKTIMGNRVAAGT